MICTVARITAIRTCYKVLRGTVVICCHSLSRIAAIIYHNCFGDNTKVPAADPSLDYGANYANMLGFTSTDFWELMRLYIVIHA